MHIMHICLPLGLPSSGGRPTGNPCQNFYKFFREFPLGPGLPLAKFGVTGGNTVGVTSVFVSALRTGLPYCLAPTSVP